jgi:hypothetical protein
MQPKCFEWSSLIEREQDVTSSRPSDGLNAWPGQPTGEVRLLCG